MGSQTRYFLEDNDGEIGDDDGLFEDGQDWQGSLAATRRTQLNVQVRRRLYTELDLRIATWAHTLLLHFELSLQYECKPEMMLVAYWNKSWIVCIPFGLALDFCCVKKPIHHS